MKGKNAFTQQEVEIIKKLIQEKLKAVPEKQKGIRDKIRKIGFYYTDFSSKKDGYTVEDFVGLIRNGKVKVVGAISEHLASELKEQKNGSTEAFIGQTSSHPIQSNIKVIRTNTNLKKQNTKDEHYVLDLCDKVLGLSSLRQHKFDFLLGDTNAKGVAAKLPVDSFYSELNLVVEYRERQHTESVNFFDKPNKMTVSGVNRGEQRKIYDERRRNVLPKHNIHLVEISFSDFNYDGQKRIIRNPEKDLDVVKLKLKKFLS